MSKRRRIGFAIVTVVLILGVAEFVMHRLAPEGVPFFEGAVKEHGFVGHSAAVPYFMKQEGAWVPNRSEMSRYTRLPVERSAGALRVGVFGGSTIASDPPDGPTWQLAAMLSLGSAGEVHVLNGGGNGYGSTRVRGAMIDALKQGLDVVVLYAGHNEFTESRYVPALSLQGGVGGLMQALRQNSRVYEALRLGIRDLRGQAHAVSSEVPGGPLRSGEMARLETRFRENLEAMAAAMKTHGVRGVWVLPASSLGMPPEASIRGEALAQFERGRAMRKAGDRTGALEALGKARDGDQIPRRATSGLVKIMAEVAASHQIPVVDSEAVLYKRDPDRTLLGGFSADRMHLDAVGYRVVMTEVYWTLARELALQPVHVISGRLPEPGASLVPVLGPVQRTVAGPTLSEMERKQRGTTMTGGR